RPGSSARCCSGPAPTTSPARPARTGRAPPRGWRNELPRVRDRRLRRVRAVPGLGLLGTAPAPVPHPPRDRRPRPPRGRACHHRCRQGAFRMNPIRKRRLLLVLALLAASAVAATLVALALRENITYLYTPSQVYAGEAADQAVFRLGGMVARDSLQREQGSLKVSFGVTDGDAVMTVRYEGILPDLFRENQAVIATGKRVGDEFHATQVLAKHDEQYMPREVAEAMGKAHRKHNVPDDADAGDGGGD